eukprot:g10710.t1
MDQPTLVEFLDKQTSQIKFHFGQRRQRDAFLIASKVRIALGVFIYHRHFDKYNPKTTCATSVQLLDNHRPGIDASPDRPEQEPLDPLYPPGILHPKHDKAWQESFHQTQEIHKQVTSLVRLLTDDKHLKKKEDELVKRIVEIMSVKHLDKRTKPDENSDSDSSIELERDRARRFRLAGGESDEDTPGPKAPPTSPYPVRKLKREETSSYP